MRKSKLLTNITHNYVYLIREREFIRTQENIYKLGKTTQVPNSRLQGYPKESEVLLFIDVPDCHKTEKALIVEFDKRFTNRSDIGREYYEGDLNLMKKTFFEVTSRDFIGEHMPIGWLSWMWKQIWRLL
jgi:hypothetical protein